MSEKRFVVQEDVNTDKIILLIDYKRMKMYSFLAEEREAVNKICNYLNWFDECTDNYVVMLKEIEESNCEKSKEIAELKKENEQLKKEKEQLFRDLVETQGSYVRLICFVRRLELSEDDLKRFEEEIGGE